MRSIAVCQINVKKNNREMALPLSGVTEGGDDKKNKEGGD